MLQVQETEFDMTNPPGIPKAEAMGLAADESVWKRIGHALQSPISSRVFLK